MPEDPITKYLKDAYAEAKQIVSLSASVELKAWGIGADAKLGPIKANLEVNLLVGTGKVENNTIKLDGSALKLKGELGLGSTKGTVAADVVKVNAEIPLNKGKVSGDVKALSGEATAEKGSISINNSSEIGAKAKVSPVEIGASIHLDHLGGAIGNLYNAAQGYVQQKIDTYTKPQKNPQEKGI